MSQNDKSRARVTTVLRVLRFAAQVPHVWKIVALLVGGLLWGTFKELLRTGRNLPGMP